MKTFIVAGLAAGVAAAPGGVRTAYSAEYNAFLIKYGKT